MRHVVSVPTDQGEGIARLSTFSQGVFAIGSVLVVVVFVWAMFRATREPGPSALLVALGLLTLTAIVAFAITGADTLGTIAATGVGALAGAVSTMFREPPGEPPDDLPAGDTEDSIR